MTLLKLWEMCMNDDVRIIDNAFIVLYEGSLNDLKSKCFEEKLNAPTLKTLMDYNVGWFDFRKFDNGRLTIKIEKDAE